jgi:hypothetical protein
MMKKSDQLMTSFVTPFASFCYVTMLADHDENAGATYQRCILRCFRKLIRETVEAYMDDIVVKSNKADQLMADLEKTFEKLRANSIKLNLEKCIFGVPRGMLLGFIVFERDIEANPEKISAITRMG